MAQTIKLKRSATPAAVPSTSSLALGEVAINTYDGKMFIKKDDGTESVVEIGALSGISNIVEDTTPQLGGDLDVNGRIIRGRTEPIASIPGASLELQGGNTGTLVTLLKAGDTIPVIGDGKGGELVLRGGTGKAPSNSYSSLGGDVSLQGGAYSGGVGNSSSRRGNVIVENTYDFGVGVENKLTFKTGPFGGSTRIEVSSTGVIRFNDAYSFPTSDGSAGQVLTTDGSGSLTFTTVSGGSGGIGLTDLSVTVATAGTANLSYNNTSGVFTYTPPDLSGYLTSESNNIQYENVKTYTVTVDTKDATHPQFNNGSANGYKINGTFAPFLHMVPGMTYRFDQSDASNSGHPLVFYYDEGKTTAYTTGVTNNGTPGSAGAYTEIVVSESTPATLYYQCSAHEYMGWGLNISTHNLTGFDTDDLAEGSTNLYYTTTRFNTDFSNKSTTDLSEGTNLYHTATRARGAISGTGDISYDSATGVISFNNASGYLTSETYSTASELLTAIKTVDGTTSGLDADLLDGQEGSHYLDYTNFTSTPTSILDFGISDGTSGQVLQTDGSGNFSFTTVSGGGGAQAGYAGYEDYYYNVTSTTSTFGTSVNTHDKVQVFKNGVYLDDSQWSFVQSTGIVTLVTAAENGDEIAIWGFNSTTLDNHELVTVDSSGNVSTSGTLQVGNHRKEGSLTSTIATTNATNVVMYASADYVGSKLIITITDGTTGDTQITEALILTVNGGTPKITTYGTMYTSASALASFDVANVSTNTALEVTMSSANSSTVKVAYTLIDS